jgi:hypothetical protein
MRSCWQDIADPSAEKRYTAFCRLVVGGDKTVDVLRGKVAKARPTELSSAPALIKQVDASDFKAREQASRMLTKLGSSVEPLLRKAIADGTSLEAKRRLEKIMSEFATENLRQERTALVLEAVGTENAHAFLADLANGDPEASLTRSAKEAVLRLDRLAKASAGSKE